MRLPPRSFRRAALGAAALGAAVACSPDRILRVETPDVIDPITIRTAAGAEALRTGALFQLNRATGGVDQVDASTSFIDSMVMLGGLLADEWRSGDTFVERDETDRRAVRNQNALVDDAYRMLERARVSAQLADQALAQYNPEAPAWQRAQMQLVQGFVELFEAEHFCAGMPTSEASIDGTITYGPPLSTAAMLERAIGHLDAGLAALGTDASADPPEAARVRAALRVSRGRALLDLGRRAEAAAAVRDVATSTTAVLEYNQTLIFNQLWDYNNNQRRYTLSTGEGGVGLAFATAGDARLPACRGGTAACTAAGVSNPRIFDSQNATVLPLWVQLRFPTRDTPWPLATGVEARLIEAEAQLAAGGAWLATLNALRGTVSGLAPLADPGTPAARADLLFRERAFWLFGTGHRLGDLRRLVRQYGRPVNAVYPSGPWVKGGEYGTNVSFPIPQSEENNPQFQRAACDPSQP
ncbi:MAG TPA: hypothetical protein VEZ47_10585 [Gemmatirosa sp.]|nr:hypothetical protein [Gemmatirosa sp.]